MRNQGLPALASLLLTCAVAAPAAAGLSPYFRVDYGGYQLKMSEGNDLIKQNEAALKAAGLPAAFQTIPPGYGPSASAGLWVLPGLRIGATYSYLRSVRSNRIHIPGQVFYADDLEFRMTEIGTEASVRITRLGGFTVGGSVARGQAEMIEGYTVEDVYTLYYQDANAKSTKTTYGAFIGFDQTNPAGLAGFIRAGFQYRDMGSMPSQLTISDGTNTYTATSNSIPLDYSGVYFKIGFGYDLVR